MSDSYPTIQDSLSNVQKEFLGCVEMHLDPPDHDGRSYAVEAIFSLDSRDADLPGDSVRFTLSVDDELDDFAERRHMIEFIDRRRGAKRGWIRHRMRRVEAMSGRYFWTESRFEVAGPGVPEGHARHSEVEREVAGFVDEIRRLDRSRRLVELTA